MMRKITACIVLFLILSVVVTPVIAAGGNGGSSGTDGAGSGGSGAGGNGDGSSGNAGDGAGSPGTGDQQVQVLQEEQERREQATVEQTGVQITQQDRDQTQGRTGVDTTVETASLDSIRQRDRDNFLQQISQLQQNLSQDQDQAQAQAQAQVHLALSAVSLAGNVTGSSGPELARMGAEVNNSLAAAYQAEQQMKSRSSFMRMLFGGDREAAGLLIQYADQNQQRIQQMTQVLANCSDCDPQVRVMLEEQVQVLSQEQNRLLTFGQQEQNEKGFFGWLL